MTDHRTMKVNVEHRSSPSGDGNSKSSFSFNFLFVKIARGIETKQLVTIKIAFTD